MDCQSQALDGIKQSCRSHLSSLVSQGLGPFQPCVFDLDILLSEPSVDLDRVTRVLDSDARFGRRVLYLSNSVLLESAEFAQTVTEAAILLGPCLFQAVVLVCAVTDFGDGASRDSNAEFLWTHAIQIATISEGIAELSEYPVRGVAFLAGLFHDIGHLALRSIAEREGSFDQLASLQWKDNLDLEREFFGMDHCQIGQWMAKSWGFSPSLVDAILHHHDPQAAEIDPQLAEIVCAAEYYCDASPALPTRIQIRQNIPAALIQGGGQVA